MRFFLSIFLPVLLLIQCQPKEDVYFTDYQEKPEVPSSIMEVHKTLLDQAYQYTLLPDSAGLAAIKLYELMQYHFKEEEDYVLPPLGLLPMLANGEIPEESEELIQLTEKLKSQLAVILAEHQMVVAYLEDIKQVASDDYLSEINKFEKELQKHAQIEEEVFFPASILIDEYVELKSIQIVN
jgi:hypothetical protein